MPACPVPLRKTDGYPAGADDPSATVVYEGTGFATTDNGRGTRGYYTLCALPSGYTLAQAVATAR